MKKNRLYDIDRAKGLAIFLVVVGHLVARGKPPEGADWYLLLKFLIYKFHMAFFMFTSGVVFYYVYKEPKNITEYKEFILRKINRLLPAFVIFGLSILVGKVIVSTFLHVDNVNYNIFPAIIDMMIMPSKSVAGSLWYIYVLLELYLLAPILLVITRKKINLLIAVSLILHFVPASNYFMLNSLFEYTIYFFIGVAVISNYTLYKSFLDKYFGIFIFVFLLSFLTIPIISSSGSKLIIGLCSIPALHGLVSSKFLKNTNTLLVLGKYTFVIYLLNTITIGLAKGVLFKFIAWDGHNFIIYFFVLLYSGIVLPILIKKYIFRYSSYITKITD